LSGQHDEQFSFRQVGEIKSRTIGRGDMQHAAVEQSAPHMGCYASCCTHAFARVSRSDPHWHGNCLVDTSFDDVLTEKQQA